MVVTLGPLSVVLFDPTPIANCDDCPESAFLVSDSDWLARAVPLAYALLAAAMASVVFMRLVRRYRAASPPLRRVVGPVYLFTLEALAALVAGGIVSAFSESAGLWLEHVALISLAFMPVAFLAGILRTRLARAGIADLAIALGNGMPLRDALADALGDPSLELAYWSAQRESWVDEEGRSLSDPIAKGARAATFVEHGGQRVAALLHDRTLTDQRELVDAVAATASLAFEKERLQAEIRAQYRFLADDHRHRAEPPLGRRHRGAHPQLQPRRRGRRAGSRTEAGSRAATSGRSSSTRTSATRWSSASTPRRRASWRASTRTPSRTRRGRSA